MKKKEKEVLQEIRTIKDEFENYFANTIIPQVYIDAEYILRRFTPPAMRQFDLSDDHLGKPIFDVLDNFRFPSFVDNIKYTIEHREIVEKEVQTTDMRWYQMNILPYIRTQDNRIDGVIVTFVDISKRINDLKEQERLIAENEILFDTVVHDIKGPLSVLSMAATELKKTKKLSEDDFGTLLNIVDTTVEKMVSFVNEVNENRKAEYDTTQSELLNFENVLEDVMLSLRDPIYRTKAKIHLDIQISQISFKRRKLRSILYNLILNSIKYKAPDRVPEISIKSFQDDGFTVISVEDNGIGIKKALQKEVFRKYVREDASIEGTGIGLHLVKQIITNAGGKVELQSTPGKGTDVKIFIPNAPE